MNRQRDSDDSVHRTIIERDLFGIAFPERDVPDTPFLCARLSQFPHCIFDFDPNYVRCDGCQRKRGATRPAPHIRNHLAL